MEKAFNMLYSLGFESYDSKVAAFPALCFELKNSFNYKVYFPFVLSTSKTRRYGYEFIKEVHIYNPITNNTFKMELNTEEVLQWIKEDFRHELRKIKVEELLNK